MYNMLVSKPLPFLQGWVGGGVTEAAHGGGGDGDGGGEDEEVDPNPCPLESMFLALEQVLPLLRRRRQATLLKQVRPAVEGMCGRSFTRQHLAQIVHVQPGTRVYLSFGGDSRTAWLLRLLSFGVACCLRILSTERDEEQPSPWSEVLLL